jgi:hypothetical protein
MEAFNVKKLSGTKARVMAGAAVSAAFLVPLSIFGGPAFAGSAASQYEYGSGSAQYQYRVTICHLTGSKKHPGHTITVSSKAVPAHLAHGDHLGRCDGTETPRHKKHTTATTNTTATTTTSSPGHGKGHKK